ncbi:uncharacterized protein V6R79_009400 [Siganus canaliculatus]
MAACVQSARWTLRDQTSGEAFSEQNMAATPPVSATFSKWIPKCSLFHRHPGSERSPPRVTPSFCPRFLLSSPPSLSVHSCPPFLCLPASSSSELLMSSGFLTSDAVTLHGGTRHQTAQSSERFPGDEPPPPSPLCSFPSKQNPLLLSPLYYKNREQSNKGKTTTFHQRCLFICAAIMDLVHSGPDLAVNVFNIFLRLKLKLQSVIKVVEIVLKGGNYIRTGNMLFCRSSSSIARFSSTASLLLFFFLPLESAERASSPGFAAETLEVLFGRIYFIIQIHRDNKETLRIHQTLRQHPMVKRKLSKK